MELNVDDLLGDLSEYAYNPSGIQRVMVDMVERMSGGENLMVSATSPFAMLLEASGVAAATTISSYATHARRLNAKQAESVEDLSKHLSDYDTDGRFAVPSRTNVQLRISIAEIDREAVTIDNTLIRKLTVPKDTVFQMNGTSFGIHYPIDIKVMPHGGIHVNWDGSNDNPLESLTGNVVDTVNVTGDSGVEYLLLDIPVHQFSINSTSHTVSKTTGVTAYIDYTDNFYTARCYTKINDTWVEMAVTHNEYIYDRRTPTAVLAVQDGIVKVTVPQIYLTESTMGDSMRVDLYTTQGDLELHLINYTSDSWGAEWLNLNDVTPSEYVSALTRVTTISLSSDGVTAGGTDGLSFEELRERTIYSSLNDGSTYSDLVVSFGDLGYDLSVEYDNITDRGYLATRALPAPTGTDSISTIGVTVGNFDVRVGQYDDYSAVVAKAKTITILPSAVFDKSGTDIILSDDDVLNNPSLHSPEEIANTLNQGDYVYTPFHYVLDVDDSEFTSRCYYMDSPVLDEREFVDTNSTYPLDISIGRVQVKVVDSGYQLILLMASGDAVKVLNDEQLVVQLAFTPKASSSRVYMTGTLYTVDGEVALIENERAYIFNIDTEWEIDTDDYLFVNNFLLGVGDTSDYGMELTETFDILVSVNGYTATGTTGSDLDSIIGSEFLPAGSVGLTHERLVITFGDRLSHLEGPTLTYSGTNEYVLHEADVPVINTVPQYKHTDGIIDAEIVDGKVSYTILSNVGEQAVDDNGELVYSNRVGDVLLDDETGLPIVSTAGERIRRSELVMLDAKYRFTTEEAMVAYSDGLSESIVSYVTDDMEPIAAGLPPRTNLRFTPKANSGNVNITVSDGVINNVAAGLSFSLQIYLTTTAYDNSALREEVESIVSDAINKTISNTTISTYSIAELINASTDENVIGVHVDPLTSENVDVFTITDSENGFSVASKLIVLSNGTLKIIDDITIEFLRHTV